jgi:16S rRNA (adenine1518-N6/adenine1519-N6)-dimethyltransferase
MTAGPRQTLSYLRNLLDSHRIRPKNKLGQNFLIDLNLLDIVVGAAELTRQDLVLEVGSGTGSLTNRLADEAGAVLSVEIDPDFYALACETVAGRKRVRIMHADILKNKNTLNPGVMETLAQMKAGAECTQIKLVANLPYAVATPVIGNLLLTEVLIERIVVMVQWEIAERMTAEPGSKEFGALAVLVQSLADVEIVRGNMSPSVFWPRPQVASAIVCIRPSPRKRNEVGNVILFRDFLRSLYAHRRKNLRGGLAAIPNSSMNKQEVDSLLAGLGLDGTLRAEALSIEQHQRLFHTFVNPCSRKL